MASTIRFYSNFVMIVMSHTISNTEINLMVEVGSFMNKEHLDTITITNVVTVIKRNTIINHKIKTTVFKE